MSNGFQIKILAGGAPPLRPLDDYVLEGYR